MKTKLLFSFIVFSLLANAQYKFHVSGYNQQAQDIMELPGGNYLFVAYSPDGSGGWRTYADKLAPDGSLIWQKSYHGVSGSTDMVRSCCRLPNGTYALTGYGTSYAFILNTDSIGNMLYSYNYGTFVSAFGNKGYSIIGTSNNKIIMAGQNNFKGHLLKTDFSGNVIWGKVYNSTPAFNAVQETPDLGYIATGNGNGTGVLLMKTDSSGTVQWCKTYMGSTACEEVKDIKQTADAGFILVGNTCNFQTGSNQRVLIIKTDSVGNVQWFNVYGLGTFYDYGYSIETASNGGYIIGGYTKASSSAYTEGLVFGIDSIGNLLWGNQYSPNSLYGYAFATGIKTSDQGYAFFGGGGGGSNLYGMKMDANYSTGCFESAATINVTSGSLTTAILTPTVTIDNSKLNANINYASSGNSYGLLCTNTGYSDNSLLEKDISIFPNLTSGAFIIESKEKNYEIEIANVLGEKIHSAKINSNKIEIDLSKQPNGIYFLRFDTQRGTAMKKIMISK